MTQMTDRLDQLINQISPLLADSSPEIVGATLGQLCATFIASHAPPLRAESVRLLHELIDELTPVVIEEMIEAGRVPESWREPRRKFH